jgi:hypothetical protein
VSHEEDRDRSMDRLLRQSLRAPKGPDASGPTRGQGSCLDAETIATWADGGLKGKDLEIAEAHLSECARCQALAAALVQTAPGAPSAEPRWWRPGRLGWLVPLSAAAIALLVWVVVPTQKRGSLRVQEPSGSQVSVPAPEPPSAASNLQTAETARDRAAAPVPSRAQEAPEVSRAQEKFAAVAPRREMKTDAVDKLEVGARVDEALSSNQTAVAASPAAPPATAPASPAAVAAPAALPARKAGQGPGVGGGVGAGALSDMRAVSKETMGSSEIVSLDGGVRWRIIRPASVERSTDGGTTWELLSTGLAVELTGGAAPSGTVCWLIGRGGTVLLSTDGRRWQRVAFPDGADLIAIQATDARTAIVTTADGRRFRTADGGVSWIPG